MQYASCTVVERLYQRASKRKGPARKLPVLERLIRKTSPSRWNCSGVLSFSVLHTTTSAPRHQRSQRPVWGPYRLAENTKRGWLSSRSRGKIMPGKIHCCEIYSKRSNSGSLIRTQGDGWCTTKKEREGRPKKRERFFFFFQREDSLCRASLFPSPRTHTPPHHQEEFSRKRRCYIALPNLGELKA